MRVTSALSFSGRDPPLAYFQLKRVLAVSGVTRG
jgi:hypothetical protein